MNAKGIYQRSDVNVPTVQPTFQGVFTTTQMQSMIYGIESAAYNGNIPNMTVVSDSFEFDAWGDLARLQEWSTTFANMPYSVSAAPTLTSDITYRYDALGNRISENGTQLYYDAAGNVIEERNSTTSPAATIQYFWNPVESHALVLRDRALYTGGNIGVNGSGLSERLYAVHDPSNNVTAILGVAAGGGNGYVVERYTSGRLRGAANTWGLAAWRRRSAVRD